MTKHQQKQLSNYIKKLSIQTEGEQFILKCILEKDWDKQILLQDISIIKYNERGFKGMVGVVFRTMNASYSFGCSHLGSEGFGNLNIKEQKRYIIERLSKII